ncbi:MAG: DUF4350 domain-containing protein [Actinomycetes bacterium]
MAAPLTTADGSPAPVVPVAVLAARLHRWRAAIGLSALVVIAVSALVLTQTGRGTGLLAPDGTDGAGAKALVAILRAHGVRVVPVTTAGQAKAQASAQSTVLVTEPALVTTATWRALRARGADLVLVSPGQPSLTALGLPVQTSGAGPVRPRSPDCTLAAATVAGDAWLGGQLYAAEPGARVTTCYPSGPGSGLIVVGVTPGATTAPQGTPTITLIGAPSPLTNADLAFGGNAALATWLLGARPTLVWYRPDPLAATGSQGLLALVPPPVRNGLVIAALALALLAAARARRLGPVVDEPLPVRVLALETTEGRGRLYQRTGARGRAAAALREAWTRRARERLGLPRTAPPPAVVAAVSRITGWPPGRVAELLYGTDPPADAALVDLAGALDELEDRLSAAQAGRDPAADDPLSAPDPTAEASRDR